MWERSALFGLPSRTKYILTFITAVNVFLVAAHRSKNGLVWPWYCSKILCLVKSMAKKTLKILRNLDCWQAMLSRWRMWVRMRTVQFDNYWFMAYNGCGSTETKQQRNTAVTPDSILNGVTVAQSHLQVNIKSTSADRSITLHLLVSEHAAKLSGFPHFLQNFISSSCCRNARF